MNLSGGTLLAFDFGLKRIGVAVGNTVTRNASPHKIIHAPTNDGKFAEIAALISEWQPFCLVVGVPRHPDGAEHEMTVRCRRFANQLNGRYNLPVVQVDERYSSAILQAGQGEYIDDASAAVILQQYFDKNP